MKRQTEKETKENRKKALLATEWETAATEETVATEEETAATEKETAAT